MPKVTAEIPHDIAREIDRIIRDGWYADPEAVVREALASFLHVKSFLGDSPRMLHRFAADALNDSKPVVALKFVDRAIALMAPEQNVDLGLYQSLVELRVQILMILDRDTDALTTLETARERLPNNPSVLKWIARIEKKHPAEA